MNRSDLRAQLKVAWLPAIAFAICTSVAVINHPPSGSLGIRDGAHVLVFKHGYYQIISKAEYDAVRCKQWLVFACVIGMGLSLFATAYLLRRAGLPISSDQDDLLRVRGPYPQRHLRRQIMPIRNRRCSIRSTPIGGGTDANGHGGPSACPARITH
jgi:hypothetical protein